MQLLNLLRYFSFVIVDGDWANDWLTHLDPSIAEAAQTIGQFISSILF
jgi:hypothetical protein